MSAGRTLCAATRGLRSFGWAGFLATVVIMATRVPKGPARPRSGASGTARSPGTAGRPRSRATTQNAQPARGGSRGPGKGGPAKGKVTAIVNGKVFKGNPREVPLGSHENLQLDVGAPLIAPETTAILSESLKFGTSVAR